MNYGDLHYLLLLAFNRSNKAIVRQTAKGDLLPGQPKILEFLWEHPDCTQKEISLGCGMPPVSERYRPAGAYARRMHGFGTERSNLSGDLE